MFHIRQLLKPPRLFNFLILGIIGLFFYPEVSARELTINSFNEIPGDLTARIQSLRDLNDELCAVVKIVMPEGAKFEGNVLKDVYDVNEYHLYLTKGTKYFNIKYPGIETLNVSLPLLDYPNGLESGVTYRLKLSGFSENPESSQVATMDAGTNYLVMNITPKTGVAVKINGSSVDVENGEVIKLLKYGDYTYSVEAEGYEPKEGTVKIARGDKITLPITLKSIKATLVIKSETSNVNIAINGKKCGNGNWEGNLSPGIYNIEISREGFRPYNRTIELAPTETQNITIPALTPIFGSLNINYKPTGSEIYINREKVGTTPMILNDVQVGTTYYSIVHEGYKSIEGKCYIEENKVTELKGELEEDLNTKENEVFRAVEESAEFPGGQGGLMKFLRNNLRYPKEAHKKNIQGRVVVQFIIEKDGSISQSEIVKGVDPDLDKEALRVVNKMPKWKPGKNNDIPVRTYFILPIIFKLPEINIEE